MVEMHIDILANIRYTKIINKNNRLKGLVNSMTKESCIEKMRKLVEIASPSFKYNIIVRDWEKYGKSRTYFQIIETREHSTHRSEYDCGYYDNISQKYIPGRTNLADNYSLSGNRIK